MVIVNKEKCCEGENKQPSEAPSWTLPGHSSLNLTDVFPPGCLCQGQNPLGSYIQGQREGLLNIKSGKVSRQKEVALMV